jgi:hypothetical protein
MSEAGDTGGGAFLDQLTIDQLIEDYLDTQENEVTEWGYCDDGAYTLVRNSKGVSKYRTSIFIASIIELNLLRLENSKTIIVEVVD